MSKRRGKLPDGFWKREGPAAMMVTSDSAQQYWPREKSFACNANHSQLAKLKRGQNSVYPNIKRAIQQKIHTSVGNYAIAMHLESPVLQKQKIQSICTTKRRKIELDDLVIDAIVAGDAVQSRYLLDEDYNIHCKGRKGLTILLLAAILRQNDIIQVAFDYGAYTWAATDDGYTTLHLVALNSVDAVDEIVSDGDRKALTRSTMELLLQHNPPMELLLQQPPPIEILRKHGLPLDKGPAFGKTPLHIAVWEGQTVAAECLIQYGADTSATDTGGCSALHYAVIKQRVDMVDLLIAHGASVNARMDDGGTPLHVVARCKFSVECASIVRSLVMAGADLEVADSFRRTPLLCAIESGRIEFVKDFLKRGSNINARTHDGKSTLHLATSRNEIPLVRLLLKLGANPCTMDDSGRLPYATVEKYSTEPRYQIEMRQILEDAQKHWKESSQIGMEEV